MPNGPFGAADRDLPFISMPLLAAHQTPDSRCLGCVADSRRSGVRVDVVDLARLDPAVFQRLLHRQEGARPVCAGRRHVVSVAARPVAPELGVDAGPARPGVLQLLQHEHGRALGHHEPAAPAVEGAAARRGVVVESRGQRPRPAEPGEGQGVDAGLRTPGHHHVGIPEGDEARRIPDRMGAGRARRRHGVVRSLEAVLHGNVARRQVGEDLRHE